MRLLLPLPGASRPSTSVGESSGGDDSSTWKGDDDDDENDIDVDIDANDGCAVGRERPQVVALPRETVEGIPRPLGGGGPGVVVVAVYAVAQDRNDATSNVVAAAQDDDDEGTGVRIVASAVGVGMMMMSIGVLRSGRCHRRDPRGNVHECTPAALVGRDLFYGG